MHPKSGPILIIGGASWNQVIHLDDQLPARSSTHFARSSYETPGGTGLGKAVNLSLLGQRVIFQTPIGGDTYGREVRSYLDSFELDLIAHPSEARTERHTNLMLPGDQRISLYTSPPLDGDPADMKRTIAAMRGAAIIAPSILPYVRSFLPAAKASGSPIWVDLHNFDGEDPYHQPFIEAADIVFVSGERLPNPDAFMKHQIDHGKSAVIVTKGKHGADCLTSDYQTYHQDALPVDPIIDTNGAGDAFFAGFAHHHLSGAPIQDCLYAGAMASALAIQTRWPAHPTLSAEYVAEATDAHLVV